MKSQELRKLGLAVGGLFAASLGMILTQHGLQSAAPLMIAGDVLVAGMAVMLAGVVPGMRDSG